MKQFHWLLCIAKIRDWSRKITPLSNLTRASPLVDENLQRKQNWTAKSTNLEENAGKIKSVFVTKAALWDEKLGRCSENYRSWKNTLEKLVVTVNRVRTVFQKQISRTFPGLFQDSDWFFKGSKIHFGPFTPKISMLILLTAFHTLHIFYLSSTDFHDFPGPVAFFKDFPVPENATKNFQDFPGFPGPVRTLGQPRSHLIQVLNEGNVTNGGDFCFLWLVILKSAW